MRRTGLTLTIAIALASCTTASLPTPSPEASSAPSTSSTQATTPGATQSPTPTASPSAAPTATVTPEPAARTFTSDDGLLTIDAPAGALPDDVELTATAKGPDDLPPELSGLELRSAFYRLEPDGLTFAAPVTITRRSALADLGFELDEGVIPLITLALRTSEGNWSWLDDQKIEVDGEEIVVSGKATHTSTLMGFGGTTFARREISDPDATINLDQAFIVEGSLEYAPGVDPAAFWAEVDALTDGTGVLPGTGQASGATFSQSFTCAAPGTNWVGVSARIGNLATHPIFGDLGLPPTGTELYIGIDLTCLAAAASPTVPNISFQAACFRVVHESLGRFLSFLEFFLAVSDPNADLFNRFELTLQGANDGEPRQLTLDDSSDQWTGDLGLHNPGAKKIVRLVAVSVDGHEVDLTTNLIELLGTDTLNVRYPQEDVFGTCPEP